MCNNSNNTFPQTPDIPNIEIGVLFEKGSNSLPIYQTPPPPPPPPPSNE